MGSWLDSKPSYVDKNHLNWFQYTLDRMICSEYFNEYLNYKKIVISDCDGILTSGKSLYSESGKVYKEYGAYDKEAMVFLTKLNWEFHFVTGDKLGQSITFKRIDDMIGNKLKNKISYSFKNADDRLKLIVEYKKNYNIVCFCGDSISDIPSLCKADFAGTTNNAPKLVKHYCNYVSDLDGGSGGFADIILNMAINLFNKRMIGER